MQMAAEAVPSKHNSAGDEESLINSVFRKGRNVLNILMPQLKGWRAFLKFSTTERKMDIKFIFFVRK